MSCLECKHFKDCEVILFADISCCQMFEPREEPQTNSAGNRFIICKSCGYSAIPSGTCFTCLNCGETSGCS